MNYIEWLRVRNTLRIVAIILGILVVLAVVLRISVSRYMSPDTWIEHFHDAGTTVSHVTLPDGTKRTILDNPGERTHVTIDDHGYSGKHIVVTEPRSRAHKHDSNVSFGSIRVVESPRGAMTTTIIDTNGAVPMAYYMALADVVALITATILAAGLAREINGHLEIALTKPCSRLRYAVGVIGVDVAGIVAASVLTVIAFYLCQLLFESPRLDFSGLNARAIVTGIALPLAWYAMLCAATTWLYRGYGAVLGFAWPVAILVGALTLIQPTNVVALFVHDVAWALSRLDPLSYVSFMGPDSDGTFSYAGSNFAARLAMQLAFFFGYGGLAVWQWHRVEA